MLVCLHGGKRLFSWLGLLLGEAAQQAHCAVTQAEASPFGGSSELLEQLYITYMYVETIAQVS